MTKESTKMVEKPKRLQRTYKVKSSKKKASQNEIEPASKIQKDSITIIKVTKFYSKETENKVKSENSTAMMRRQVPNPETSSAKKGRKQKYRSLKDIGTNKFSKDVENLGKNIRENPLMDETDNLVEDPRENYQCLFGEDITEMERDQSIQILETSNSFEMAEIEKGNSNSPLEIEGTPSFQVRIAQHNLAPFYHLDVPAKLNRFLPHDNVRAILVCRGERLNAGYYGSVENHEGFNWKIFVVKNDLKVGDVCLFELMDESNSRCVVFRVQIL